MIYPRNEGSSPDSIAEQNSETSQQTINAPPLDDESFTIQTNIHNVHLGNVPDIIINYNGDYDDDDYDENVYLDPEWVQWTEHMTHLYGDIVVNDNVNVDYDDVEIDPVEVEIDPVEVEVDPVDVEIDHVEVDPVDVEHNEWIESDEYKHQRNIDTQIDRERLAEKRTKRRAKDKYFTYVFK